MDQFAFSASQFQPSSSSWMPAGFSQLLGFSSIMAMLSSGSYLGDSVKLFFLGTIIETGRRLFKWLIERFQFRLSITARFSEGDPAYDWIILFLTQENVWRRSRDFDVNSKTSSRKFGIKIEGEKTDAEEEDGAEYVPVYEIPQLFSWKGYWVEIKREQSMMQQSSRGSQSGPMMYLTMYTLNMSALKALVDEAKRRYVETSRPNVIIHSADIRYGMPFTWNKVKSKTRRPLSSIILPEGVLNSLVDDLREFIDSEDWYIEAGIPYRRGYILYGPPGTGKSSTIYTLAGELGLEIYTLSLAAPDIDDTILQNAAAQIPKHSILLIEDIDCAFPSREDEEEALKAAQANYLHQKPKRTQVTLSGLLNVLDGVESDEGKFFMATTNYIDRLDPALLRPGRIDRRVQYRLTTKPQSAALFTRFFPESRFGTSIATKKSFSEEPRSEKASLLVDVDSSEPGLDIPALAAQFADGVPEDEFTVAELQGYLLPLKKRPRDAAANVAAWVAGEQAERRGHAARAAERKAKARREKTAGMTVGVGSQHSIILSPVLAAQLSAAIGGEAPQQVWSPTSMQGVSAPNSAAAAQPSHSTEKSGGAGEESNPKVNGVTDNAQSQSEGSA
ncbi:hypothetical protein HGRIS_000930 [Hohenbuehelia grisea]|uniref:Mitochondrial chaperone BCS1 n=1 Tax=Hohenbuehelia grisea TaxID=104357 RepID=A0ABR3IQ71_9AGAR